jgi:hypothetical protein
MQQSDASASSVVGRLFILVVGVLVNGAVRVNGKQVSVKQKGRPKRKADVYTIENVLPCWQALLQSRLSVRTTPPI